MSARSQRGATRSIYRGGDYSGPLPARWNGGLPTGLRFTYVLGPEAPGRPNPWMKVQQGVSGTGCALTRTKRESMVCAVTGAWWQQSSAVAGSRFRRAVKTAPERPQKRYFEHRNIA
jgi:alpha-D-ribose 1-methylphosphonate 5-triphosphate synthase subunit PhnG